MRALSSTLGQVSVAWTVIEKGAATTLKFEWREHGGPTVTPPNRRRFGNPLLKAIFGEARIDYAPEGVSCAKPNCLLGPRCRLRHDQVDMGDHRPLASPLGSCKVNLQLCFRSLRLSTDVPAINPAKDRRHRPGIDRPHGGHVRAVDRDGTDGRRPAR